VQVVGTSHMDRMMGAAADRVVVQVERVVSNEVIRRDPERTLYWRDTTVVRAPFGCHPYSSGGVIADEEHLREFLAAARGGEPELAAYLDRYVRTPADHEGYLEEIGARRLVSLLI
jgi:glutaconate CoA-transferase subunit A